MTSAVLARMLAAAADDDDGGGYVDTVAVHPDAHLLLPPGTARFGNHSCDPSLWFDGPYALAARRAIAAGDELTLDYGTCSTGDGFALDCRCGAAACRRPGHRRRLAPARAAAAVRPPLVPVLLARID